VYFIQCNGDEGPIKIGMAVDPPRRLSELRIGCPYPMVLLAAVQVKDAAAEERRYHALFASQRIHGEWFTCSEPLRSLAMSLSTKDARRVAESIIAGMLPR
jgi:hypothetical protein